jgi:hypothetical protein
MEFVRGLAIMGTLVLLGLVAPAGAEPGNDQRAPDLSDYPDLRVGAGHKVAFSAYAEGVQIWVWDGEHWNFQKPEAVLYSNAEDRDLVGIHYRGPTWESASGSFVVGLVLERATPNPNAIPWLKLGAVDSGGPGIFDGVTYIQRVNTVGGLAPGAPGVFPGQEARVPYTADYFFYRSKD